MLKDFAWAPRGPTAELASLKLHAGRHVGGTVESPSSEGIGRLVSRLPRWNETPLLYAILSCRPLTVADFSEVLADVKLDSRPGVPYQVLGHDNREVLTTFAHVVLSLVAARIRSADLGIPYADPCRIFVKNEPHKVSKLAEGRYRLIANLSLVDQIVERILHGPFNKACIDSWARIPLKPGMGLSGESRRPLHETLGEFENPLSTDASGFDWAVTYQMLAAANDVRTYCAIDGEGAVAARTHLRAVSQALWMTSDGNLYYQNIPGIQRSGRYCTSSDNSIIRALICEESGSRDYMVMGDDCVEDNVDGARVVAVAKSFGFSMSIASTTPPVIAEFCSHYFESEMAYPVSWHKLLFRLVNHEYTEELRAQFVMELKESPEKAEVLKLLDSSGWAGCNQNGKKAQQQEHQCCEDCYEGCGTTAASQAVAA